MKFIGVFGLTLFCIGTSTIDANQLIGAVMALGGMGLLVMEAKKEGMWR